MSFQNVRHFHIDDELSIACMFYIKAHQKISKCEIFLRYCEHGSHCPRTPSEPWSTNSRKDLVPLSTEWAEEFLV